MSSSRSGVKRHGRSSHGGLWHPVTGDHQNRPKDVDRAAHLLEHPDTGADRFFGSGSLSRRDWPVPRNLRLPRQPRLHPTQSSPLRVAPCRTRYLRRPVSRCSRPPALPTGGLQNHRKTSRTPWAQKSAWQGWCQPTVRLRRRRTECGALRTAEKRSPRPRGYASGVLSTATIGRGATALQRGRSTRR